MDKGFWSRISARGAWWIGVMALVGCGGAYQPSRAAPFDAQPEAEINDEDVRKAFEARPQLGETLHVAYYTFDPKKAGDTQAMLAALPGVASVYRIPPLLVTGQRRYQEDQSWAPPKEMSLKKLRLLAARARADVLVVVDHGYRWGGVNGLAALNILLVPVFFVPFLDNEVESYVEAFVIDTRNGYLYGHVTEDEKSGPKFATLYADGAETIADQHWEHLRAKIGADLTKLLADERAQASVAKPATPATPPPAAPAKPTAPSPAPPPPPSAR